MTIRLKILISIIIVFAVLILNFQKISVWAAANGGLGLLWRLSNPILPTQVVDWQQGPALGGDPAARPPNIIVILADDLGWNDISFYGGGLGGGAVQTPNIDAIARAGVHLTNGYAGSATCAPSRAALLTGRYPTRYGFEFTPSPDFLAQYVAGSEKARTMPDTIIYEDNLARRAESSKAVPASEIMLPQLLKQAGYHSVILGKWHLGQQPGQTPPDRGFDEFLGFLGGVSAYADADDPDYIKSVQDYDPRDRFLWANDLPPYVKHNNGPLFTPAGYMTDYLSQQAVAAIDANRNRPFFMYLAYNAPHTPLHAKKADYDRLPMIANHTERVYGAMMLALDRGIGQVMAALDQYDLTDNTLVIFTSDNGGAHYVGLPDLNKPYRGWKTTFFEGGIHTPFFIKWPARIQPGSRYDEPAAHIDIFATAAAAAGLPLPSDRVMDGVDLVPFVTGAASGAPHRAILWRSGGYSAAISQRWKIQVSDPPGKTWLFDLGNDPTEQHNLAASEPVQLARMQQLLAEGQADWVAPLWPQLVATPIAVDTHLNEPGSLDEEYVYWGN